VNTGKTLFAQVMEFVPWTSFTRIVQRHGGDSGVRALSCAEQFRAMAFAQLTWRESLRDIEASLSANASKLYAMGFRSAVKRSTLADANESRDWRIWSDLAALLIRRARKLYASESALGIELDNAVYALDSSTIDLCLSLFAWAPFRSTKAAIKLHTLLDLRGAIPAFIHISDGKLHDVHVLDMLAFEAGAFYVMDRGYLDFGGLARLHEGEVFFVVRSKCHVNFRVVCSRPVDKTTGLRCDQTVRLGRGRSRAAFPGCLRRVRVYDEAGARSLVFLTNQFELPAITVAELYRRRWQVELFFKWIKGHLRLRAFLGRTENAVRLQVWSAICAYLLVAIAKKQLGLPQSLHQILQVISVSVFETIPLAALFAIPSAQSALPKQLLLLP